MNKKIIAVVALLSIPAVTFAKSISVTDLSLDGAESQVAVIAQQHGADYKITGASSGNLVRMTAVLSNIKNPSGVKAE